MKTPLVTRTLLAGLVAASTLSAQPLFACAACFGKSDSRLALGMNYGIFVLLGVVFVVLSGVAGFGFYLVKKSAEVAAAEAALSESASSTEKV